MTLDEVSAVEVPSLPAESIGAPLLCDPAGRDVIPGLFHCPIKKPPPPMQAPEAFADDAILL